MPTEPHFLFIARIRVVQPKSAGARQLLAILAQIAARVAANRERRPIAQQQHRSQAQEILQKPQCCARPEPDRRPRRSTSGRVDDIAAVLRRWRPTISSTTRQLLSQRGDDGRASRTKVEEAQGQIGRDAEEAESGKGTEATETAETAEAGQGEAGKAAQTGETGQAGESAKGHSDRRQKEGQSRRKGRRCATADARTVPGTQGGQLLGGQEPQPATVAGPGQHILCERAARGRR